MHWSPIGSPPRCSRRVGIMVPRTTAAPSRSGRHGPSRKASIFSHRSPAKAGVQRRQRSASAMKLLLEQDDDVCSAPPVAAADSVCRQRRPNKREAGFRRPPHRSSQARFGAYCPEPGPYWISTRRFSSSRTPSAVSTRGRLSPNAELEITLSGIERAVRYDFTESARRCDRPTL